MRFSTAVFAIGGMVAAANAVASNDAARDVVKPRGDCGGDCYSVVTITVTEVPWWCTTSAVFVAPTPPPTSPLAPPPAPYKPTSAPAPPLAPYKPASPPPPPPAPYKPASPPPSEYPPPPETSTFPAASISSVLSSEHSKLSSIKSEYAHPPPPVTTPATTPAMTPATTPAMTPASTPVSPVSFTSTTAKPSSYAVPSSSTSKTYSKTKPAYPVATYPTATPEAPSSGVATGSDMALLIAAAVASMLFMLS